MTKQQPGARLLHKRNSDWHNSPEVMATVNYLRQGGANFPNEPEAKIAMHIDFLADPDYVNDGILTGNETSVKRQMMRM